MQLQLNDYCALPAVYSSAQSAERQELVYAFLSGAPPELAAPDSKVALLAPCQEHSKSPSPQPPGLGAHSSAIVSISALAPPTTERFAPRATKGTLASPAAATALQKLRQARSLLLSTGSSPPLPEEHQGGEKQRQGGVGPWKGPQPHPRSALEAKPLSEREILELVFLYEDITSRLTMWRMRVPCQQSALRELREVLAYQILHFCTYYKDELPVSTRQILLDLSNSSRTEAASLLPQPDQFRKVEQFFQSKRIAAFEWSLMCRPLDKWSLEEHFRRRFQTSLERQLQQVLAYTAQDYLQKVLCREHTAALEQVRKFILEHDAYRNPTYLRGWVRQLSAMG